MKALTMITIIATILQTFRTTQIYLRKNIKPYKKITETIILIISVIISYFMLEDQSSTVIIISLLLISYVVISFVLEQLTKKNHITRLSIKKAIDMADTGILFLNKAGNIILINNTMQEILNELNIKNNYFINLIQKSFYKIEDVYLIKSLNKVYEFKKNNKQEIILTNVTDIYNLQEEEKRQNKIIAENNEKILDTIKNIEKIEKEKSLLQIKNEYHDLLGYRLALFTKYLEQEKLDIEDINFLLDSIYEDKSLRLSSSKKLDNLIKMYHIIGIEIIINGSLPQKESIAIIFFEIIREAITNAVIHADSKNINITINSSLEKIEMTIANDGKESPQTIHENEGIKGMKRKLATINGTLLINTYPKYTLKVII